MLTWYAKTLRLIKYSQTTALESEVGWGFRLVKLCGREIGVIEKMREEYCKA